MSYTYKPIILVGQTGTIDVELNPAATLYQITIIAEVLSPPTDNVIGTITFDASPFINDAIPVQFEPIFDGANSTTRKTIDFAASGRTLVIANQSLQTLRVIPDGSVANPYTVVIRQGT